MVEKPEGSKEKFSLDFVSEVYPEIILGVRGSTRDEEGSDGWLDGRTVQVKYDGRIGTSDVVYIGPDGTKYQPTGNLYHEYHEKNIGHSEQEWDERVSKYKTHAFWWLFVTGNEQKAKGILVLLEELYRCAEGKEMVVIPREAPTSMGYIIPLREVRCIIRWRPPQPHQFRMSLFSEEEFRTRLLLASQCYSAEAALVLLRKYLEDIEKFGWEYTQGEWQGL